MSLENVNPVEALLGEGGLAEKYGGELTRDWFDVFLVRRVGADSDVQIREGKNLTGISYDVDETDVVTRIMPTGEDADSTCRNCISTARTSARTHIRSGFILRSARPGK